MATTTIKSRGVHHVAYTTRDAEATYDFYANKLGMPLLHTENHLQGEGFFAISSPACSMTVVA